VHGLGKHKIFWEDDNATDKIARIYVWVSGGGFGEAFKSLPSYNILLAHGRADATDAGAHKNCGFIGWVFDLG